jgi:hypothetical protein
MRYIPTSAATVDALKKHAKKLQRKGGGKHADLLNRVAKGAGYDHWHHVTECLTEFEAQRGVDALDAECELILRAALEGIDKIIVTGPEVLPVPLVLFSSQGDAWLLDPEGNLAMCLIFHGQKMERVFRDSARQIEIAWDGPFHLDGEGFAVQTEHSAIGTRVIFGYPLDELRPHIQKAQSIHKKFDAVFMQGDAQELTPELIERLVAKGWERKAVENAAREGARYIPIRNGLLTPAITGGFGDDDDDNEDDGGPMFGPPSAA